MLIHLLMVLPTVVGTLFNCPTPAGVQVTTLALNSFPLNSPAGIFIDNSTATLFIADQGNNVVRAVNLTSQSFNPGVWNVTTSRSSGFAIGLYAPGIRGGSVTALLNSPQGVTRNPSTGDVYVADTGNFAIVMLRPYPTNVTAFLLAGKNTTTSSTDGVGSNAGFAYPLSVAFSSATGLLYVSDKTSNKIRAVNVTSRNVTTLVGSGSGGTGDGVGTMATLYYPLHLTLNNAGTTLSFGDFVSKTRPLFLFFAARAFFGTLSLHT